MGTLFLASLKYKADFPGIHIFAFPAIKLLYKNLKWTGSPSPCPNAQLYERSYLLWIFYNRKKKIF